MIFVSIFAILVGSFAAILVLGLVCLGIVL
jgi:hypothetical protein